MLTPSVLASVISRPEPVLPVTVCIIWRRVYYVDRECYCWHFFCRAPFEDVERIVEHDRAEMDLSNDDYQVRRG